MKINIAIVEDTYSDAAALDLLISAWGAESDHEPEIKHYLRPEPAIADFERKSAGFDLLFVDCMMPGMQGTDFVQELKLRGVSLLFVLMSTNHSFIKTGYRLDSFDFLCKPFESADVNDVLMRAANRLAAAKRDSFIFYTDKITRKVSFCEILSVNVVRNYAKMVTTCGTFTFRKTVSAILDEFPDNFIQSTRNTVINVARVKAFSKTDAVFDWGEHKADISATYLKAVRDAFYKYN